jgi:hypothetical protein
MEQKITTSPSFKVQSAIQDVEVRLKKPVSRLAFCRLFSLLENVQKECPDPELQDKIIYLYGKILDRYVDTEVKKIVVLAGKTKRNFESLRKKIADVKLYGVSQENNSLLNRVEQKIQKPQIPPYTADLTAPAELEWIEELFSLASLIYDKEKEEPKAAYKELPKEIKDCLSKHLSELKTALFQDDLLMIQALLATAHDLAEYPLTKYPTDQEINLFFSEEKIIKKADPSQHWDYKVN